MASVKDLTRFGVDLSEARLIGNEDFSKLVKQGCMPEVGDVLIAKDGNSALDTVCNIKTPLDAVLLSSVAILRPDSVQTDSDFLKYYFSSKTTIDYLKSNFISGAAIPRVVLKDFKKAAIKLPPLVVQKEIAGILNVLDDKIELNRQINQTLEHIAQAIFKSWFVDFEPVKAKIQAKQNGQDPERAAMCAISGKTDAELDAFLKASTPEHDAQGSANVAGGRMPGATRQQLTDTSALFPDELEDSELGLIPKGWAWKPLYETAGYVNGSAFKASDFSEDAKGLPIIKIAELKQGISAGTKFTRGDFREKYKIHDGDVLYSWSGSPETSLEVFKWFGGDGWLNQHIFKLNFVSKYQKYFAYFLLRYMKPVLIRTAQQKQTTGLGHVTVADMKRIKVPYPDEIMLEMFSGVVGPIYEQASCLQKQMNTLSSLRDSLLPKLLSGEITAPSNQSSVDKAAC